MNYLRLLIGTFLLIFFMTGLFCCRHSGKPKEKDLVTKPEQLTRHLTEDMETLLQYAGENKAQINDTVLLRYFRMDSLVYARANYAALWSNHGQWLPVADSLFGFIKNATSCGLFPNDYHFKVLSFINRIMADSFARKNAALWTRADLLYTDAFFALEKDLKQGRLKYDSVTLRTDSLLSDSFYTGNLEKVFQTDSLLPVLHSLEPKYPGYDSLKLYTSHFLSSAKLTPFTYLVYPYKDSAVFFRLLQKRLHEMNLLPGDSTPIDTAAFAHALRKYQKEKGLKTTGKISDQVVDMLNNTDLQKFRRIALTMDRYKQLPDSLPQPYIWVNLPSFYLQVVNQDTVVFESKIIVGAPKTRTPLLSSEISNFVTLPQWTVPYSIIFKEMLPKIQKNINFLKKENLMVVDQDDNVVDPSKVNWAKLGKNHFPYQLKQQQGDNNSLGVIKFNFRNKYSVYLHDTNVRGKFAQAFRAISHGCVRLKEWQKLSDFLVRNDSVRYNTDTIRAWIKRQEKHVVSGFHRVPIYLRYFGCAGKNGQVRFYDDIYGEDKLLCEKYFLDKNLN